MGWSCRLSDSNVARAVKKWLSKAARDARTAKALLSMRPPFLDSAAFHCQQSIEKSLKAYLIGKGVRIKKIHDLIALNNEAKANGLTLKVSDRTLATISKYAVEYRYPGGIKVKLSRASVNRALVVADNVLKAVSRSF